MRRWIPILTILAAPVWAAGDAKAGKAVYDRACKSCHGADGAPVAMVAKMMKVEMRHLGDPKVQEASDTRWSEIITKGTGKMKAQASVTGKQVEDVIAYCRTLKP